MLGRNGATGDRDSRGISPAYGYPRILSRFCSGLAVPMGAHAFIPMGLDSYPGHKGFLSRLIVEQSSADMINWRAIKK